MVTAIIAAILIALFCVFSARAMIVLLKSLKSSSKGNEGYIYFITEWGFIAPVLKIGRTNNVSRRISSFRTGTPFGILVYLIVEAEDCVSLEAYFHKRYGWSRIRNNGEWFWITPMMFLDIIFIKAYSLLLKIF